MLRFAAILLALLAVAGVTRAEDWQCRSTLGTCDITVNGELHTVGFRKGDIVNTDAGWVPSGGRWRKVRSNETPSDSPQVILDFPMPEDEAPSPPPAAPETNPDEIPNAWEEGVHWNDGHGGMETLVVGGVDRPKTFGFYQMVGSYVVLYEYEEVVSLPLQGYYKLTRITYFR